MSAVATTYRHLEARPESSYRQLFIKGTRIRAEVIYAAHLDIDDPRTPEQIAADYRLPPEAVQEAISYCASNPPEIAQDHARQEAIMAATGQLDPNYRFHPYPKLLSAHEWARLVGQQ